MSDELPVHITNSFLDLLIRRIDLLEKEIKELKRFQDVTYEQYKLNINKKTPHKCLICDGNGFLSHAMCTRVDCKSCYGKGIVWG